MSDVFYRLRTMKARLSSSVESLRLRHLPRDTLRGVIKGYRLLLSPWLGSACRFEPTCSRYALTALERHGAAAGSYLMVTRILRCHPLCAGGHDPVPEARPRLFRHLFPEATVPATTLPAAAPGDTAARPVAAVPPDSLTSSGPLS